MTPSGQKIIVRGRKNPIFSPGMSIKKRGRWDIKKPRFFLILILKIKKEEGASTWETLENGGNLTVKSGCPSAIFPNIFSVSLIC